MNFLSINCATDIGSLFVKTESKTFSKILQKDKSNTDLLMNQILVFFEENDLKFDNISEILVNQGPGNFSGLRGSLSVAKGISLSKNLKLFGYDTFTWSCARFFEKQEIIYSLIKVREKFFLKKFENILTNKSKIKEVTLDEITTKYSKAFKVITEDAKNDLSDKILKIHNLNIVRLDHNELEFLRVKGLLEKDLIKPLYLS